MGTLPDGAGAYAGVAPDALIADKEGGMSNFEDFMIEETVSKNQEIQRLLTINTELLEALEAAYQSMLASYNTASYFGRTNVLCGAKGRTFYENCKLVEAAIKKARGAE